RALEPAWVDGVSPVPLLRQAAESIRARRTARARAAAARPGVRLVLPLGLCLLPACVRLGLGPVLVSTGTELVGGGAAPAPGVVGEVPGCPQPGGGCPAAAHPVHAGSKHGGGSGPRRGEESR